MCFRVAVYLFTVADLHPVFSLFKGETSKALEKPRRKSASQKRGGRNIDKQIEDDEETLEREALKRNTSAGIIGTALKRVKATLEERNRHLRNKEDIQLLAMVANTILFIAMAEMIDLSFLWKYRFEILIMFIATTLIRATMMTVFAWITNRTHKMADVNLRWGTVLSFAGIKGGLSIVMLTMIPASFEHLEMFKAIVIGVIMLSTFIYSTVLIVYINRHQAVFLLEKNAELDHH